MASSLTDSQFAGPATEKGALVNPQGSDSDGVSPTSNDERQVSRLEAGWKPGKAEWCIMITLTIASLAVALDATILVTVLPSLSHHLHGSATQAFWTQTAYLLASTVGQPVIASLSDIFGRRALLTPSIALFLAGSLACARAHGFTMLIAGRVVQGLGGGGIVALAQIIYADIVPLRQRPLYFTLVLGAWALGTMFGPVIGGLLAEKVSWRWIFYLNIPICCITIPMSLWFVRLHGKHQSLLARLRTVDWIGSFLFTTGLTSFLVGLSWGGIQFDWKSWRTLVPLALGVATVCGSLLYECAVAAQPFLTRTCVPNLSARVAYIVACFQGMILFMALYCSSLFFLGPKLQSPVQTGVDLFSAVLLLVPTSMVTAAFIARIGQYQWAMWIGWAITTTGCSLCIPWKRDTKPVYWASSLGVFGLGAGMTVSSVNFAVQASVVTVRDCGKAAALYTFMRTLGMAMGVAIVGTIFQNRMSQSLGEGELHREIPKDAIAVLRTLRELDAASPEWAMIEHACTKGIQSVFIFMTAVSGVALGTSGLVKHFDLDRKLESRYSIQPDPRAAPVDREHQSEA